MLMLNGTNYLKTAYDVNGTKLHTSYTITNNIVAGNGYNYYDATYSYLDGNGTTVYVPSSATTSSYTATSGTVPKKIESSALSKIATSKWHLYGIGLFDTPITGSVLAFYNKERNVNNAGEMYQGTTPERRPAYWYGKIGLMYPSDYGYATNGGNASGDKSRNNCIESTMDYDWEVEESCYKNDWLYYENATASSVGSVAILQWTITPYSMGPKVPFHTELNGYISESLTSKNSITVRPVLYLKADTTFSGGTGTYDNPYTIR